MFDITEELKKLPDKPGVYIMKDKSGEIIYIGKANVLKNRVRQYFNSLANQTPKVRNMVPQICEFEYIVTDTELEALILECNLIKKHKPKFNIMLKDDKTYPYIKVTMNEDYPRILMTRKVLKDGARYFGPYTSAFAVNETIDLLKKLFPIKSCNKVFPRDFAKGRPCLNYYIYQCLGPCQGDVGKDEYRALMADICGYLGGKHEEIVKRLENDMYKAAENMEFEKAARIRDKIASLKYITQRQKVVSTDMLDQDVIAFAKGETDSCIQVFFIRGGKLLGREHFIFEGIGDVSDSELMASFIKQFYSSSGYVPGEIVLKANIDEINIIENWLSKKKASRVHLKVPKKGEKQQLVEMVSQNAAIALNHFTEKVKSEKELIKKGLEKLSEIVGAVELPERLEAYDISNTGSSEIVASMVVFENGIPSKSEYRRFKLKSVLNQNDYASMQEIIYRRFTHARREIEEGGEMAKSKAKFSKLPHLILVDGGLGHVNAVSEVLEELSVNIPVLGMVKDSNHRTRGLVSKTQEISITGDLQLLRFITAIQDEAHRFALQYNKKLRKKRYSGSVLDGIEGVGPKRRKALLKHFGSVKAIKSAEVEALAAVEGISRDLAFRIYEYFKQQE
ncbi:MAG: excinuclease ABC subunit UvrC [Clostridiaceae bacterium]|nr:excinuclease ABC subunit UvrC [Clostridiaceae bacterium]